VLAKIRKQDKETTYIFIDVLGLFQLTFEFRHGLVIVRTHNRELRNEDQHRNRQVPKEELLRRKSALGTLVRKSVEEEDGGRSVKGAGHGRDDRAGVLGESVRDLEGRKEDKGASEREHDIGHYEPVELGEFKCVPHQQRAGREKDATEDCAHSWAVAVEDCADGEGGDVACCRCDGKEEVESGRLVS
jgi:hypothetical protein